MAKLVILFACIAVFHAVAALECYSCDNDACKQDKSKWATNKCANSADQSQEPVCQKLTFKDKDGKENISRKCAIVPKDAGQIKCPPIPEGATDIKCPVCKADLCNSASSVNFSFAAIASIVLAFFGQKYFL